jgi:hypothetical protein
VAEPVVRLEPTRVSVDPGGQVTVVVTAYNPGTVVEGYDVDVVSTTPMPWATVEPPTLSVYPQQEASAIVTFAPPGGPGAPGGSFPFGVRLRSQVDPERTAVAEGDLDVGSVSGLQGSLTPVTSSGRWRGNHTLKVANWGNSPARLRLVAQDPDQALGFLVSPPLLEVPPGGEGYARVKVRTRHPVLRGTTQRLPFTVVGEPESAAGPPGAFPGPAVAMSTPERPVVEGAFSQKPILTRWVVVAAGLLLAALVALVAWLLLGDDDEAAEPEDALPPNQPTGLAAAPAPGIMTLTWDLDRSVDSYEVTLTAPATDTKAAKALPDPADPARVLYRMETDRAEEHCYQVVAVREGAPPSAPSDQACAVAVLTPEQQQAAEPTAPAVIAPAPGFEPPPPPDGNGTTPPESPTTSAPPGTPAFLTPMKYYDLTNQGTAEQELAAAQQVPLPVQLGRTDELGLESNLPLVLYATGATEAEAEAACQAALQQLPTLVLTGCASTFPFGGSPSPGVEPAPTS